jgi:hypothetical protein
MGLVLFFQEYREMRPKDLQCSYLRYSIRWRWAYHLTSAVFLIVLVFFFPHLHQLSFKCNCSSQKPLPTTGIRTRDLWFCSLDLRPLDQPAVQLWASRAYILDTLFKACVIDWTVNSTSGYTKLSNFISRLSTLFLSP